MKNILIISSNRLGDCILSSGLHEYFNKIHQDNELTLVCGKVPADLFKYCDNVKNLIILEKKKFSFHWIVLWMRIFLIKWDSIIDLRGTIISFLLNTKNRYRYKNKKKSNVHKVVEITENITGKVINPNINLSRSIDFKRDNLLKIKNLKKKHNLVMIAPTANWKGKIWPAKRYKNLIISLKKRSNFKKTIFILVGPMNEKKIVKDLLKINNSFIYDLFGKSSLIEIFHIMKICDLFIGNDSGLMHMAALANIKTIGLFGPSDIEKYRPWGENNLTISSPKTPEELMGHKGFSARNSSSLMLELKTNKVIAEILKYLKISK